MILCYIRAASLRILSERQSRKIRQTLFQSILEKDFIFFDKYKTGEFGTHLSDTIDKISDGIGEKFGFAVESIAVAIIALIISKTIHLKYLVSMFCSVFLFKIGLIKGWKLTIVLFSLLPIVMLIITVLFKVNQ